MRRATAALMTTLLLLLCGCAGVKPKLDEAMEFRSALLLAETCSFTAEVTADFGQSVEEFTLACQADDAGDLDLCVLAPESIAEISARVTQEGGKVTYEGMQLEFGLMANDNVAPIAAPALAFAAWRGAYIVSAGTDEDGYRVTYQKDYDNKALIVDTWYKNKVPICAEVCYNNRRILKLTISDFILEKRK